ncbi:MAG: FIST C-terminal domain-containing protein [Nitrosomonadales bacterium]|nr:FIST C-terminal domain-containing protein [Nitrosomonadales bacterium]
MQINQIHWSSVSHWSQTDDGARDAGLVLVFADTDYFHTPACHRELKEKFPQALIVGCSSSGSVQGSYISDDGIIATAVKFKYGRVRLATADVAACRSVRALAANLMEDLAEDDLRHVLVFSDGLLVNGSELAAGLNGYGIPVTGGLAGDGARFGQTWVMANAPARPGCVAAVGLYGNMAIKTGCFAGWEEFGAERVVTRSSGNVVSEIDGQPALTLYKKYLGPLARDLPGSGLRFPLSVRANKESEPIIRTLLSVSENARSLTFAGDVPEGHLCKLMRTRLDALIESAGMAAATAAQPHAGTGLGLVVSCVGRRLVLGQLIEEELEAARKKLGPQTTVTGFYSYGELAPFSDVLQCQLHNQTMTLTTIHE